MKPKPTLSVMAALVAIFLTITNSEAQEYKLKQVTSMSGMKSETTIYVKGPRKRTEGGGFMGQGGDLVKIEQCDKQRTITLNDKKKLYYIEPFAKPNEEIIEDDIKPAASKPSAQPKITSTKGGVVTMYYSVVDTAERKKMFGFTARHIWTTNKMMPSADACMKDSLLMKTDGWYIDLPEFNCPVSNGGYQTANYDPQKPQCQDKYITRRSGKGKLGFPLIEKRTIIMGGKAGTSEFVTDLETLEFTTAKLDSMLFTIPPGYTQVERYEELKNEFNVNDYLSQVKDHKNEKNSTSNSSSNNDNGSGKTRIGIYEPKSSESGISAKALQQHTILLFTSAGFDAIEVANEEEARTRNCVYVLNTDFSRIKQASKVGGLIKAIKNTDPNAASSFNIEATLMVTKLADGSVKSQEKVQGKFEGTMENATKKAMDEGTAKTIGNLQ